MKLELVEQLVRLFEESKIDEMEVEQEGLRISLKKHGQAQPVMSPLPLPPVVQAAPVQEAAAPVVPVEAPGPKPLTIDAPMVGTFYRAASPDAAPYISVGDQVSEETVVCILEAMKVMNEIKSGVQGVITQILVENAQPVEYGQPLFVVKSSSV